MTAAQIATLLAEIKLFAREMKLPTVAREAEALAIQSRRAGDDPLVLLHALLAAEHRDRDTRRAHRRVKEAHFPLTKTLEGFAFKRNPTLDEGRIRGLAHGGYIQAGEPVLLIGGTGTGKTHIGLALGHAACALGTGVRFVTAAGLANELVEADQARHLSRIVARYARFELLVIDELGYLPLTPIAAQLLFQVIAERGERRATIITTNLPFSEWTTVIEDPRLCRAFIERITFRAHIIETGDHSVRLEDMLALKANATKKEAVKT